MGKITVKLAEIAIINPGIANISVNDELVAFVPMASVSADPPIVTVSETRPISTVKNGFSYFQDGDILIAKITPCFENGKIAQARIDQRHGFGSTEFHVVRASESHVDARYLLHFLRQRYIRLAGERKMTGSAGQRRVPKHFLESLEIPLPPIAEQKRIAAILDKAESLRSLRRQTLAQLDILTQSIFLEMFGNPATNPKGWDKGFLGDVAVFVGGGTPKRERPEYFEGSICWATSKDMKHEFLDDTQEHITPQAIEESATNLVPIGTILIVVKSKILAHSLPVAITKVPTCFGQDIKGIKISQRCTVTFVATALRYSKKWLLDRARGINTEGLTLDHLRAFPLILPPLPLQQEFARRVEAVEQLKATHRESLAHLDALFASLQHRAFRGEL